MDEDWSSDSLASQRHRAYTLELLDNIIQDTAAEKAQDMVEVGVTLNAWEYRMKWLGEDEATARPRAGEIGEGVG